MFDAFHIIIIYIPRDENCEMIQDGVGWWTLFNSLGLWNASETNFKSRLTFWPNFLFLDMTCCDLSSIKNSLVMKSVPGFLSIKIRYLDQARNCINISHFHIFLNFLFQPVPDIFIKSVINGWVMIQIVMDCWMNIFIDMEWRAHRDPRNGGGRLKIGWIGWIWTSGTEQRWQSGN